MGFLWAIIFWPKNGWGVFIPTMKKNSTSMQSNNERKKYAYEISTNLTLRPTSRLLTAVRWKSTHKPSSFLMICFNTWKSKHPSQLFWHCVFVCVCVCSVSLFYRATLFLFTPNDRHHYTDVTITISFIYTRCHWYRLISAAVLSIEWGKENDDDYIGEYMTISLSQPEMNR